MKKTISIIVAAFAMMIFALPASAKVNFGVRGGLLMDNLKYDFTNFSGYKNAFNDKLGWQVGVMVEVPVLFLDIDAAVMYTHHKMELAYDEGGYLKHSMISIPINLKYKLNILGVGKIIKPMVFTGPEFGFRISDEKFSFKNITNGQFKSFNTAWNFGFGVELFKHLQITAAYSLGLNKSLSYLIKDPDTTDIKQSVEGTNRHWTVSAAVIF